MASLAERSRRKRAKTNIRKLLVPEEIPNPWIITIPSTNQEFPPGHQNNAADWMMDLERPVLLNPSIYKIGVSEFHFNNSYIKYNDDAWLGVLYLVPKSNVSLFEEYRGKNFLGKKEIIDETNDLDGFYIFSCTLTDEDGQNVVFPRGDYNTKSMLKMLNKIYSKVLKINPPRFRKANRFVAEPGDELTDFNEYTTRFKRVGKNDLWTIPLFRGWLLDIFGTADWELDWNKFKVDWSLERFNLASPLFEATWRNNLTTGLESQNVIGLDIDFINSNIPGYPINRTINVTGSKIGENIFDKTVSFIFDEPIFHTPVNRPIERMRFQVKDVSTNKNVFFCRGDSTVVLEIRKH